MTYFAFPGPASAGHFFSCLLLWAGLTACSRHEAAVPEGKTTAIPVVTVLVMKKDVPLMLPAIGTVQPRATVTVRPQVGGKLAEVHFHEGDFVKAGDLLFTIDPRPFEVARAQATAALDQARAEAANARLREARYLKLDRSGSVSAELVEQIRTDSVTAGTKVAAASTAVEQAQLELDYCHITAPLTGRAGRRLLAPGNIVQANLTELTVINEIQPIEVSFTLAGRHLPVLRQYSAPGRPPLQVTVTPEGSKPHAETGTVVFVDNAVRPTSGTIEVRALFPNDQQGLWPGQFADVRLRLSQTAGACTVPAKSIQNGQHGFFVFVISPGLTAQPRPVKIERMFEGEALIAEGLQEGERVVMDGQSLLRPGVKVELRDGPEKAPLTSDKSAAPAATAPPSLQP